LIISAKLTEIILVKIFIDPILKHYGYA